MTVETEPVRPSAIVPDGQESGWGERPPFYLDMPGERVIAVPDVKDKISFQRALRRVVVSKLINSLKESGKYVAIRWSAGEIRLFIANHRKTLIAFSAISASASLGGWYITRRLRRKK